MKSISGFFAHYTLRPLLEKYLRKQRTYRFQTISIQVMPGVFHPGFFFSTKYLLKKLLQFKLDQHTLLELGAGSGLLSFVAEQQGAIVTASDLSRKAIENLLLNKSLLSSQITIIHSDLFDQLPPASFDFILINPPYYPKIQDTDASLAWYCGEHFEYYEKLFSGLAPFLHAATKVLMILSEECDLVQIQTIAAAHQFSMREVSREKFWGEWNYIFEVFKF